MKRIDLPEAWRDRALVITEVDDPRSWFTDDEYANAPALERRRNEWMLARIAAKELTGRFARTHSRSLSLSHSGAFGGAAFDERGAGIDIEVPRKIKEAAAHLFLTDEEEAELHRCELRWRVIHFWAAKEAAWKRESDRYQTLRQLPLRLLETTPNGLRFDRVETYDAGDVIVALSSLPLRQ